MIRYLEDHEKTRTKALYREAFPEDPYAFVEYYYSYVTRDNQMLVLEQDGELCSMIHLNPYRLSVGGEKTDAYYYVAVATKADYRHQGMMRKLLHRSLKDIHHKGHPFTYLMPANKAIYEPFDFRIIYRQEKVELPMEPEAANEKMSELFDVYTLWDAWYVEKQAEETKVCAGEPPFDIVPYIMARITHVEKMLSFMRSEEPMQVTLQVRDEIISGNNGTYAWKISPEESICRKISEDPQDAAMTIGIAELTEFVFGRKMMEGLEKIKTLSRICINEAV